MANVIYIANVSIDGYIEDADGNASWGPTSRPVPQWTRPGATPVDTLGRQGSHH